MLAVQTGLSLLFGQQVWSEEQPTESFWVWWMYEYHTSLVADVFGAILLVLLSKRLREIGSAEDSGSDDPNKTSEE